MMNPKSILIFLFKKKLAARIFKKRKLFPAMLTQRIFILKKKWLPGIFKKKKNLMAGIFLEMDSIKVTFASFFLGNILKNYAELAVYFFLSFLTTFIRTKCITGNSQ